MTRNYAAVLILSLLSLVCVGCGSQTLSRSKAAGVIAQNPEFAKPKTVKIPVGDIWWDWADINSLYDAYPIQLLQKDGILTFQESGLRQGVWMKEYITALTPHGSELAKTWIRTKDKMPNYGNYSDFSPTNCWTGNNKKIDCASEVTGTVYSMVVARRRITEVTGIAMGSNNHNAEVDFEWTWLVPSDAEYVGKGFSNLAPTSHNGQAEFQLFDDGWRLVQINTGEAGF